MQVLSYGLRWDGGSGLSLFEMLAAYLRHTSLRDSKCVPSNLVLPLGGCNLSLTSELLLPLPLAMPRR